MATVGTTSRPAYVYDQETDTWVPVGVGPHTHDNFVTATTIDAKGDLLAGSAPDTVGRLPIGANGTMLVADSTQTLGMAWTNTITVASGTTVPLTIQNNGTGNSFVVNDAASDTTPFVVDSNGRLLIGNATSNGPDLEIINRNGTNGTIVARGASATDGVSIQAQANTFYSTPTYTMTGIGQNSVNATGTTLGIANGGLGTLVFQNTANAAIYTNGGSPIVFGTSATERMRLDSSGNLGIGTTTPVAKLDVNGTFESASGAVIYGQNSTNISSNNGLILGTVAKAIAPSGGQGGFLITSNDSTNPLQGTIGLVTDPTGTNRRLSIGAIEQNVAYRNVTLAEGGGSVGIGTATPARLLTLQSPTSNSMQVSGDAGATYTQYGHDNGGGYIYQGIDSKAFKIFTNNAERISIASDGTSTFTGQLTSTRANNTATGFGQVYLNGATANRIDFNTNGVAAPSVGTRSAGTKIVLYPDVTATNVDFALGIDASTFWQSVPTSASGFKWYAATTNIASLSGGGTFTVTGNVTAYSDKRLKSNVETIENALEKVSKLRGVSFDKDGQKGIGVIAQEIQEVLPEVVQDGEYLSVAYGNIVGLLIEAIKEQQKQIEDLKSMLGK